MRHVIRELGWIETDDEREWSLFWSDQSISADKLRIMKPYQVSTILKLLNILMKEYFFLKFERINHFVGTNEIT